MDQQHGAVGGASDAAPDRGGLDHLGVGVLLQGVAFGERIADDQADVVLADQVDQRLLVRIGDIEAVVVSRWGGEGEAVAIAVLEEQPAIKVLAR